MADSDPLRITDVTEPARPTKRLRFANTSNDVQDPQLPGSDQEMAQQSHNFDGQPPHKPNSLESLAKRLDTGVWIGDELLKMAENQVQAILHAKTLRTVRAQQWNRPENADDEKDWLACKEGCGQCMVFVELMGHCRSKVQTWRGTCRDNGDERIDDSGVCMG